MHWIHVEESSPLCYKYRYTLNELEQWKITDLCPKQGGHPSDMGTIQLPPFMMDLVLSAKVSVTIYGTYCITFLQFTMPFTTD